MAKFCYNCGHPISEGKAFCENCGVRLQPQQTAQPKPVTAEPVQPKPLTAQPVQPATDPEKGVPYPAVQTPPVQPHPQPAVQYPQNNGQQPKKKGWIVALIIAGVLTIAAVVVVILVIIPLMKPHHKPVVPTEPTYAVQQATEAPTQAPTQAPTKVTKKAPTQAPTQTPTKAAKKAPAQKPTQAPTKAPKKAPAQTPTQAPKKTPKQTPTQPPAKLPYADSLGKIEASDFAWIADAMGGSLSGSFIGKDELVGKWKGEIIYDGAWELVYVTIGTDGSITVAPYRINYGDGWEDESSDDPYLFSGSFDINRVYGSGKYGTIDIYQFVESGGTQYAVGEFHVSNGNEAKMYLVRP